MRNFTWQLNWIRDFLNYELNHNIRVLYNGRHIGFCKLSFRGIDLVGDFTLNEDLEKNNYILYSISINDDEEKMWLSGILIIPPEEIGTHKSRKISEMIYL